jgi:hypothetical protein
MSVINDGHHNNRNASDLALPKSLSQTAESLGNSHKFTGHRQLSIFDKPVQSHCVATVADICSWCRNNIQTTQTAVNACNASETLKHKSYVTQVPPTMTNSVSFGQVPPAAIGSAHHASLPNGR